MKKYGGTGLIFEKNPGSLIKERKQPPAVILKQVMFYNIYSVLVAKNGKKIHQVVQFMNFSSQVIFFNDINHGYRGAILRKTSLWMLPFYMTVATCWYYEKVHRPFSETKHCNEFISVLQQNTVDLIGNLV